MFDMKTYICIILASIGLISCTPSTEGNRRRNIIDVTKIKNEMIYFKDERTGLCFAYYSDGSANGGPALTVVPEAKVKDFLVK